MTSRKVNCFLKLRETMPYTVHLTRIKNNYWAKNVLLVTAGSLLYRVLLCIELPPYYIRLLVLNWRKPALDVNKVKYNDKYLCEKIPLLSLSCYLVSVHGPNKSIYLINSICPFRLYVLFSQCRSCDDLRKCFFLCSHYLCIYLHMNERKLKEMVVYH